MSQPPRLFSLEILMDGTVRYSGKEPKSVGVLSATLRDIADALDSGKLVLFDRPHTKEK